MPSKSITSPSPWDATAATTCRYGIVLVGNRQTQQLEVAGTRGQGRPSRSILARVQRDRVGCLSSDVRSDERFATTQSLALAGTRAILTILLPAVSSQPQPGTPHSTGKLVGEPRPAQPAGV